MPKKIEISHKTIIFTIFFLGLIWFVFFIKDIIFQIFVALLIMTILNPTVTRLKKNKIPRVASVLIVYFLVFGFLIAFFALLIPPLVEQSTNFAQSAPRILQDLKIPIFVVEETTRQLTSQLSSLPAQILRISVSVFSNVVSIITVLFFALYFLLARDKIESQLSNFLKSEDVKKIDHLLTELEKGLGGWARGQLILMFMVGISTYIGLLILDIPFAVPIALLAGVLEIIPNIGPVLSAIPAVIVGFGISPLTGVAVAALGFLIQQVENYVFVPKIMEKSTGVSPIITLISLAVGFRLAGIVGMIISIPSIIILQVLVKQYFIKE